MNILNTTTLDQYRNESIFTTASQEWWEWMRVLVAWCTDLRSQNMDTIDTSRIIDFFTRFYTIHEKIHHRVVLILICTMEDPKSIEELEWIADLNYQFLQEQKKLTAIIQSLQSKTFFWEIQTAWNTKNYMKFVIGMIDDLTLDWSINPTGSLIFDPVDSLSEFTE